MRRSLEGETAVVTGSSRGIGEAIATRFAAEGASVVINSRRRERAEPVADAIREAGGEAIAVAGDVSDRGDMRALVDRAVEAFGSLDVFVNNAGITHREPIADVAVEDWQRVLDVNLTGTFLGAQAAGEVMRDQATGGQIVNVSSMFGEFGVARRAPYNVSKAGVDNLTKCLAVEWGADGVQVNALAPGYVKTEMSEEAQAEVGFDEAAIENRTPMGRYGTLEEIENCALFLAAGDHYLTGEVLHPDGGWLAFGWGSEGD